MLVEAKRGKAVPATSFTSDAGTLLQLSVALHKKCRSAVSSDEGYKMYDSKVW